MRINSIPDIEDLPVEASRVSEGSLPFPGTCIQAGFPSPAEDYMEMRLDLNKKQITHPSQTFFVRVNGESMNGDGISDGDLLVVDRSLR